MYNRNRGGFFGGLSGGLFLIFLAIAFTTGHFLPMLFVGLAAAAFFGSMASGRTSGRLWRYSGAVFMLGLAFLFPDQLVVAWILVVLGISAILGALGPQIIAALGGMGINGDDIYDEISHHSINHHSTSRRSINRLSRQLRLCRHIRPTTRAISLLRIPIKRAGNRIPILNSLQGSYPQQAKSCASTRDAAQIGNLHIVQD